MPDNAYSSKEAFRKRLAWQDIDTEYLHQLIHLAKMEDLAGCGLAHPPDRPGDVTTALMPVNPESAAQLTAREPLVLCGLGLVQPILENYEGNSSFETKLRDGQTLGEGDVIGILRGNSTSLLQGERVLLNFLQHLSGIATETRRYVDAMGGSDTLLLDTRKTLPGYRVLQKYAFACGGGYNHRIGLFDRVMLKDNHLAVAKAGEGDDYLTQTVSLAVDTLKMLPIEVEVDHPEQIPPVIEAGADIILLDNFPIDQLKEAIRMIDGRAITEASGGIQIETLPELSRLGLDCVSTGAPIHQSTWKDIGLDWF